MAPHSSTLAWKIPWMWNLVGYSPWGHKSRTRLSDFTLSQVIEDFFSLYWRIENDRPQKERDPGKNYSKLAGKWTYKGKLWWCKCFVNCLITWANKKHCFVWCGTAKSCLVEQLELSIGTALRHPTLHDRRVQLRRPRDWRLGPAHAAQHPKQILQPGISSESAL